MKQKVLTQISLASLFLCLLYGTSAFATDGYFSNGVGIRYKSMAGAGIAWYLSPMAGANNPATMVFYGNGYDLNFSLFNPNRQYTVTGNPSFVAGTFGLAPGTVESDANIFVIPSVGANWMLNENMSIGINIFGNGGMNTTYNHPTFGFQTTGINLSQLFIAPSFAVKFGGQHSLGLSPIIAYQSFEANGLLAFGAFSSDATNLSNNGSSTSFGFGARLGYMGEFTDFLSFGVSIQSPIKMGKFEKYSGLFAEGGDFDIPMNWTAGIGLTFGKIGIALDFKQIFYSKVKSINNALLPNLQQSGLGSDDGAGFGWQDVSSFKFGLAYEINEGMTFRAGYSYNSQPIPKSEVLFNILAPGVVQHHLTLGLSKSINKNSELSFSLMRALPGSVKGDNPLEFPGRQSIEISMDQWEFGVGFTFGLNKTSGTDTD